MCDNEIIKEYLSAGKKLTLLNGKIPKLKDWTTKEVSEDKIMAWNGNLGMVIGDGDLVIDVDPKNGGQESFDILSNLYDLPEPTVMTPSGGFHIYMFDLPEGSYRKTLPEYPGIDFLTKGSQCVIASSSTEVGKYSWYDTDLGGFDQEAVSNDVVQLITKGAKVSLARDMEDLGDFSGLIGSGVWSRDKVLSMLAKLDPSMPNDQWVKVGMALHDWDPVDGLAFWEHWSIGVDSYIEGETEKRWRSFNSGGGVTLGSISYMVKEVDFNEGSDKLAGYLDRIENADEKSLNLDVCPAIRRDDTLDPLARERLAVTIQRRFKDITSVKPRIAACRDLVTAVGQLINGDDIPDWCNEWVYVNSHRGYVDFKTLEVHKTEAFNLVNTVNTPKSPDGGVILASQFVTMTAAVQKVDGMAYLPMQNDRIGVVEGLKVLNSFNVRTVPETADEYDDDGLAAIEKVKRHIKFICATDDNADMLTQWIAHQVQYPGKQMLYAPLIQSIQGVGKSFFSDLMSAILGDANVGTVSPSQVTSDFNGWAANVCVNVLEELQIKGHNRYEVVNALKPLITDRMIQINSKGVKPYRTLNTANYICFTNAKDSIPLDNNDRRWWVMFVPISSLDELEDHVGEPAKTYFPALFDAVRSEGAALRKWFLEYEITEDFKSIKQAPMTEYKKMMAETEDASIEGLAEIREMIEKGGQFYNKNIVSTAHLFGELLFEYTDLDIKTSKQAWLMKRLGFQKVTGQVKIGGKPLRIWVKQPMSNSAIREAFE